MARLVFTILGCGSSGGVPRLGGVWGDCDPKNPRNHRRRCSLLVERIGAEGTTTVLIDTSPDMRAQLLDAGIGSLDAVVYTHSHADHMNGIDDLRQITYRMRRRIPVWADGPTQEALLSRFGYAFVQPHGSPYPPILDLHTIKGPITIQGAVAPPMRWGSVSARWPTCPTQWPSPKTAGPCCRALSAGSSTRCAASRTRPMPTWP